MVMCELTMFPIGKGTSLSPYVARILEIISEGGLPYKLTPMSTIMEGSYDEVMSLVARCFEELMRDCDRISVTVRIDYRSGNASRLESKVKTIEQRLGKTLSTG